MRRQPYLLAHPCPQCGAKDSKDAWEGARMWSSAWGHDFACCSDECGLKLAKKVVPMRDTKKGRRELKKLWEQLAEQCEYRLSGEPYQGYPWR